MTRDQFVEMYQPLADGVLHFFLYKHPHLSYLRDDLQGAAYLKLVEIAVRREQINARDLDAYLFSSIRRAMHRAVRLEDTFHYGNAEVQREELVDLIDDSDDSSARIDLEAILTLCRDDLDTAIVELRVAGHSDEEISNLLQIGRRTIGDRRAQLEKRYDAQ